MTDDYSVLKRQRVLVADEDREIVSLIADVLGDCGAEITPAVGTHAVIDALRSDNFDLIIQALGPGDVDGWAVLEYLRIRRPEMLVRMILMTGCVYDVRIARKLYRLRMPTLFKPFNLDDLRRLACYSLAATGRRYSLLAA